MDNLVECIELVEEPGVNIACNPTNYDSSRLKRPFGQDQIHFFGNSKTCIHWGLCDFTT